jgi:predicted RNase H-like HicB family nuclease
MHSKGYIFLTFEFRQEGRRWTAHCKELGTATFGRSVTEAEARLKEAVALHLNTLDDVGETEHFFKEHNIKFHFTKPKHDVPILISATKGTFGKLYIHPVRELAGIT